MKNILLLICLLSLTGCGHSENIGSLKVKKADIVKIEDLKNGDVAYYYAGNDVPANTYKVKGKDVKEDISKRTPNTETYCDGGICVMKQYFSEKYSKSDVSKELLMATTTKTEIDSVLAGFLGDTNTGSTNNKDSWISSLQPDNNYGDQTTMSFGTQYSGGSNYARRVIINFTLPSGSATISKIDLILSQYGAKNGTADLGDIEVHQHTSAWTELGVTWNNQGSYSSTVIDHVHEGDGWRWTLMGSGSENPLTLTWGDTVDLLILCTNEGTGGVNGYYNFGTKDRGSYLPYIEITYTPSATASFVPPPLIIN